MAKVLRELPEEEERREEKGMPFFPDFALREALAAFTYLAFLLVLASLTRPPLEEVANPNASGYVPRPEWYFLWLFQLLKYFKGKLEPVGTFLIPTLGIGLLLALPFLDRREARTRRLLPGTRPVRLWPRVAGAAVLLALGSLTLMAARSESPMKPAGPRLTPVQEAGRALFEKMGCLTCHRVGDRGGSRGPDLTHFASRPDARDRVLLHFSGIAPAPGSSMPAYQLSPEELSSLSEYLMTLK